MSVPRNKDRVPRPWPRFMTARVAADYSHTSPWTVRRNVRACGRRGRAFVYAIEDIERWMRGQPLAPQQARPALAQPRRLDTTAAGSLARIRALGRTGDTVPQADPLADDADSLAA